jgi:DNA-binding transcriptional LysR family regulator
MMPTSAVTQALYEERFLCVMRRGHPCLDGGFDLDVFCRLEHILVSTEGGGFRGAVDVALEKIGRRRSVRTSVPNFLVVPELLCTSDMVATVPARVAKLWGDRLDAVDPPIALPTFPISMGWSARAEADEGLSWLRAQLVQHVTH